MPKILVVDDDLAVLATISLGLRRAGYHVFQVDSGLPAIQICRREKPDLAILDMNLPDITGLQVAQTIHSETSTPFIFLSAHSDEGLVKAAKKNKKPDKTENHSKIRGLFLRPHFKRHNQKSPET